MAPPGFSAPQDFYDASVEEDLKIAKPGPLRQSEYTGETTTSSDSGPKNNTTPTTITTEDQNKFFTTLGFSDLNITIDPSADGDLSSDAMAVLMQGMKKNQEDDENAYLHSWTDWNNYWQGVGLFFEGLIGVGQIGSPDQALQTCYFIGTTYLNAITDLKEYYKLRYLYVNNLEYEIGYLTHTIVYKYQIVLELYHTVKSKFEKTPYRFLAPTTYVFYMYQNILEHSKSIIHMCNMLHEIEKKYKNAPLSIFQDEKVDPEKKGDVSFKYKSAMKAAEIARYEAYKQRMREIKKQRKQIFKSGFLLSTQRTRRPVESPFPLHYGWSIEEW